MTIRPVREEDRQWLAPIFKETKHILGNIGLSLYRCLQGTSEREFFLVIEGVGFVHFLVKQNGQRTLYNIGVASEHKRKGYGRTLLAQVGLPVDLKTDADNPESNAFYRALGFSLVGTKLTKSGKPVNIYTKW